MLIASENATAVGTDPKGGKLTRWAFDRWYDTAYSVSYVTMSLGFSFRHCGKENVPRQGPVLVLANHASYLDPVLVALTTCRRLRPLARKTLFNNKLFGGLIGSLRAVPIDQEGFARQGLLAITEQLQQGHAVLVFPEGTRSEDGEMNPLKPGVHLLIKRVKAPIVPVGIAGAFDAWPLHRPVPALAPIFLPPERGTLAAVAGKVIPAGFFDGVSRQKVLDELFDRIKSVSEVAEKLRR